MSTLRVGIIGCGRPRESEGATGFGMAHWHALGYEAAPDCEIVALADLNLDNARAFQADHGGEHVYKDYQTMLAEQRLDIVSVCTWPGLHAGMVIAAAEAGVRAIHCEKPMAPSLGEARQMVETCERHGAQLTFNHQRRFGDRFRKAKLLLDSGEIGQLVRIEGRCANLFDWGTHWFDMFFFYNNETPADWVLGQIDPRDGPTHFGVPMEGQGLSHVKFSNDVHGLLVTGFEAGLEAQLRLVGTAGIIEINHVGGSALRIWGHGQDGWRSPEVEEPELGLELTRDGVRDLFDALRTGREPELSGRRALQATELIFATYESSRRRGRVDVPVADAGRSLSDLLAAATT